MIDHEALLSHARELARKDGDTSTISHRRGVSAAYYALFHYMTRLAVEHVLKAADPAVQGRVRRAWTHGELANTASMIVVRAQALAHNPQVPATREMSQWGPLVDLAAAHSDIVDACRRFIALQEQRYAADYSHGHDGCSTTQVSSGPARTRSTRCEPYGGRTL